MFARGVQRPPGSFFLGLLAVTFTIVAANSSLVAPGLFTITLSDVYTNTENLP